VIDKRSPLELYTPVTYYDVEITSTWEWDVPDGWNGFLYVVSGTGRIERQSIDAAEYLTIQGGRTLSVETEQEIRVAAVAGQPHEEPIRQRGSFAELGQNVRADRFTMLRCPSPLVMRAAASLATGHGRAELRNLSPGRLA